MLHEFRYKLKTVTTSVLTMASHQSTEYPAVIKFCCELGYSPTQTYEMLRESSTGAQVFELHRRIREGRISLLKMMQGKDVDNRHCVC